ncbi:Williams Beuren syndrome chromosome region 27 [Aspergillus nanangensis]|uniref:Williams Beuren syndrome chromosome region 27 n=1 Tax=Aspergillus nanangensis TaxID=2582783 RepID=A0AAD4CJ64_ASPNN|nr:Williams Beuren syndrome chromosome region 27 [Aspergillus nanangensis]
MAHLSNNNAAHLNKHFEQAYALSGTSEAQTLYNEWAGAYDKDLDATGYASPRRGVEAVIKNLSSASPDQLKILDAGCGTGLVGVSLAQSSLVGRFVLDGVDLSAGMLAVARTKGMYQGLETANLNERIDKLDGSYDVVLCVGTLTKGHVGPKVLAEFARLTAPSGLIVATVLDEVYETGGFKAEIEQLRDGGAVQIVSTEEFGVLEEANTGGRMVVLKKI